MLYGSQLPTSVSVTEDPSATRMDSNFIEKHSNFTAFLRAARRKHWTSGELTEKRQEFPPIISS
jgi:hypothetical protein